MLSEFLGLQHLDRGEDLAGECLVDFEEVDVGEAQTRLDQRAVDGEGGGQQQLQGEKRQRQSEVSNTRKTWCMHPISGKENNHNKTNEKERDKNTTIQIKEPRK